MPTIDCLEILKNGLPQVDLPPRAVVIIGAGMAGLTAAMLLKEAGHTVTILEAQNRLGGRVFTYYDFPGKMYGEFGAMRFPKGHRLAMYLIQERFKLETRPFPMHDDDTFIYLDNRRTRRSDYKPEHYHYDLLPAEKGLLPQELLKRVMQPLIDIIEGENGWEQLLDQYDDYSLINYLIRQGVSDGALCMLGPLLNLEGRYHFSLLEWFSHYYDNVFGDLVYITDGASTLPNAFAPFLMNDIRLGAEVHAIEQTPGKVIVHYHDSVGTSQSVVADECVLTVPFILLRHMEIQGLDNTKWYGIRNVYYGRAHKIFMQFSERWWETKYQITHGVTSTDLAIRSVVYTPAGQDERFDRGVLIASYAWEQDSIAYSMLSEKQRISQALQDLVKIHPEARHTFEYGISHDWALDQYAGGIGPLFRPHEMNSKVYDNLVRPVDRVWFANDACDRRHRRWIEAALAAAVKNAYALHTGMRNESPAEIEH
jgi:monoamine oxidase